MKYTPPPGSVDPDAKYVTGNPVTRVKGSPVPAEAVENPQREIVEVIKAAGLDPSNADLTQLLQALEKLYARPHYALGNVYHFLNPKPQPGMVPVYGTLIQNVSARFPEAFEFFQTAEGAAMCVSEAEWQAMSNEVYWTSQGAQVEFGPSDPVPHSWDGIGGAPAFVFDALADTLRVPDMRGMFAETTGGPGSAEIGKAKADHVRPMRGLLDNPYGGFAHTQVGLFTSSTEVYAAKNKTSLPDYPLNIHSQVRYMFFRNFNVTPTGPVIAPRRYGVLSCVYLGVPGLAGPAEEEEA